MSSPPELILFFGRLHPLLVHLPIAFMVLLALMELLARSRRFQHANASAGFILALAVPASLFAVLCGWFLSWGGGYQEQLLQWHKWTGIATTFTCLVAALLYSLNRRTGYRVTLFASTLILMVASHFGGSLTHGSDYLAKYAPAPFRRWLGGHEQAPQTVSITSPTNSAEAPIFVSVIQPIVTKNCVACHGPEKAKASLRLDSIEAMLKGGESGPAIVPGKGAESLVIKRARLPLSSDDHMPPDGKPQPTSDDLALLQWWIDTGASTNKTASQVKVPAEIARLIQSRTKPAAIPVRVLAAKPLQDLKPELDKLAQQSDIPIGPIDPNQVWLQCDASLLGTNFGDKELTLLAPVSANLRWLDLGGTAVTDEGLKQLQSMGNLSKLHLERTAITDAGLQHVAELSNLEYLNLYGTAITDAALDSIRNLPKLRQVYFWQTKVSPGAAKAFAEAKIDKDQVQRWQEEIDQLKAKIREAQFMIIDTGAPLEPSPATNSVAINSSCPVSGKPVDAAKTVTYENKLIAFCCDDCKKKFQEDPKPFLAKLENLTPKNTK